MWFRPECCDVLQKIRSYFRESASLVRQESRRVQQVANNEEGRGVESAPFLCNCDGCYWTMTVTVVVEVSCWVR